MDAVFGEKVVKNPGPYVLAGQRDFARFLANDQAASINDQSIHEWLND